MNDTTPKITVAHFSFANALRDSQNGASPVHRLEAIYSFFAWAQAKSVDLIGCTEGNRAQDGIDWNVVLLHIEEKYRYRCVASALQGDMSAMAFANQLFVRLDDRPENPFPAWPQGWYALTLTPDELTGTRQAVTAPVLHIRLADGQERVLIYCCLSLSRDGVGQAYDNLVHELNVLRNKIGDAGDQAIVFGDFNLTIECRTRLCNEQAALLDAMEFQFGRHQQDISFLTFAHDGVPASALASCPEAILREISPDEVNCISALDAVCGHHAKDVRRFLPYEEFNEVPREWSIERVIQELKNDLPPRDVKEWASDHWILLFTV